MQLSDLKNQFYSFEVLSLLQVSYKCIVFIVSNFNYNLVVEKLLSDNFRYFIKMSQHVEDEEK